MSNCSLGWVFRSSTTLSNSFRFEHFPCQILSYISLDYRPGALLWYYKNILKAYYFNSNGVKCSFRRWTPAQTSPLLRNEVISVQNVQLFTEHAALCIRASFHKKSTHKQYIHVMKRDKRKIIPKWGTTRQKNISPHTRYGAILSVQPN